ncbi:MULTISPECIES: Stk1 family PASTA domain-containing Ser/Thr kinase [Bifidobacterium]|uniref:Stk1 family PASTA domain-containing Ser/Thr kinase n=1 Tax=Bifidobacterium TaxID=1678 RepID=UPI0018DDD373|nr:MULTISPECIES: Stk1 family PASTA domain-containing Ser/Thr kinase [Bifidobacterium]MBH9980605.1 PASTA domain-containing protein [Bifidobacterium asteroides]MBI0099992.1 PASTA domain-containing protein [Bifidobacterium sp. W8114]
MSEADERTSDRIIDGRYRILREIAQGGMATVYEALDLRLSRHVAVKIMHTMLAQGPHRAQFEERFRREARSAAAIANPHIVQVYDTGVDQGLDYLVMEYVHGISLRTDMARQGVYPLKETLRIVGEILDGLASAHRAGVIHRDIKPENILINDRGHVEITDFGLARAAAQATLSSTGMLMGTAAYLAPETIENNEASPQSDLYAVGIIAYEMLAGTVPFASDNPVTIVFKHVHEDVPSLARVCPGIDPSVAALVSGLTDRSPENRPDDAGKALESLRKVVRGLDRQAMDYVLPAGTAAAAAASGQPESAIAGTPGHDPEIPESPTQGATPPSDDAEDAATETIAAATDQEISDTVPAVPAPPQNDTEAATRRYQLNDVDTPSQAETTTVLQPQDLAASPADATAVPASFQTLQQGAETAKPKHRHRGLIIVLVVLLVLALAGGGGGAWWYYLGPGSYVALPKPDDISCSENQGCRVIGADYAKYARTLKVAGIGVYTEYDFSDQVPKGAIMAADPDTVGAHISKRGGNLKLTVSKGIRQATVPKDILLPDTSNGKNPLQALKAAGFDKIDHDTSKDQYSMDIPEGAAISVDPAPGTKTRHDTKVSLVLSKGRMPVAMPDIIGKARNDAKAALEALRLKVNYSEDWSDTVPRNQVISASHQAQEQLHWGDAVNVVISKGPQFISMPDVKGKSQDEATQILQGYGLKVNISAPLGNLTHTVRIQDPGPGTQVKVVNDDGSPAVVTLTVV